MAPQTLLLAPALLLSAAAASAQSPGLWLVEPAAGTANSFVNALTQDGSVAAGYSGTYSYFAPGFTWARAGGRYDFGLEPGMPGDTQASGLSSDGSVLVGQMFSGSASPPPAHAYRRVGLGSLQDLGILPGYTRSQAWGVSGDGQKVVGQSESGSQYPYSGQAFLWSPGTGMRGLGYARPGEWFSQAHAISRDGSTVVGLSRDGVDFDAFRWTQSSGMQPLPGLSSTVIETEAWGVNANGSVIVGSAITAAPQEDTHAVRWVNGVIQDLGALPGLPFARALATDDSGTVIGGSTNASDILAFLWTPATGMRLLSDVLADAGVTVPSGWQLREVRAISGDGLTFAGDAYNAALQARQGFVATIPAPASALALALVPFFSRRRRA